MSRMRAPTVCPLHGIALLRRKVSPAYGMQVFHQGYDEAESALFPYGGEPPLGGCCLPSEPHLVVLHVCSRCAEERDKWWATHGD